MLFIFVVMIILVASFFEKYKRKARKVIGKIIEKTMWNNTIRSISLSYFELCLNLKISITAYQLLKLKKQQGQDSEEMPED